MNLLLFGLGLVCTAVAAAAILWSRRHPGAPRKEAEDSRSTPDVRSVGGGVGGREFAGLRAVWRQQVAQRNTSVVPKVDEARLTVN